MSDGMVQCRYSGCDREFNTMRGMKLHHTKSHNAVVIEWSECNFCETPLIDDPRASGGEYCSQSCVKSHFSKERTGKRVMVTCKQCGENHSVYPYRAKKQFSNGEMECCVSCMDKAVERDCSWCGQTLEVHKYRVSEQSNHFCSEHCDRKWRSERYSGDTHPNWKGGYRDVPLGKNWNEKRKERLEVDNRKCLNCGLTQDESYSEFSRDLHVHHRVPRMEYYKDDTKTVEESNKVSNLMTLCQNCHMKVENEKVVV